VSRAVLAVGILTVGAGLLASAVLGRPAERGTTCAPTGSWRWPTPRRVDGC